jgi:hypothetical protein
MRIIEELLEGKVAALVLKTEINGRGDFSYCEKNTLDTKKA